MARKNHHANNRRTNRAPAPAPRPKVAYPTERKLPVTYGKAFVVLEDANKNTFIFKAGVWAPYEFSAAQCREICQLKELPQKLNGMTRYEVRCPVDADRDT